MVQPSIVGLRGVEMLVGLDPDRLEVLARELAWKRVPAGGHIIERAVDSRDVHLIVAGRVRVAVSAASGRHITYRDLGAGSAVGVLASIDDAGRSADVVAIEECLVATMGPDLFHRLLRESAPAARWLQKSLVRMVRELSDRVFEVSALGVANRVHAELLRLAREAGVTANRALIDPAPTHAEIAAQVSTYREQVTREISSMVKEGLIERHGHHGLAVPDVDKLARIVADVRRLG
ncbi:MAG: Crp/Fnr family transcriptional regulator [Burkholderiales bacterium]|nr:Crp/Fnr family transcriptional regulator [Burkholderiales bacterium]